MSSSDVQEATLNKFVAGWQKWKSEDMLAVWSDDCTQRALPFSLGHPPRSRSEVEATLPKLMEVVTNYELTIHEVIHDVARRKAVVYAISRGDTPFGDWTNEYAVFISFNESGEEITKIEEMVDSAFMKDFFPKFQKYLHEQLSASQGNSN